MSQQLGPDSGDFPSAESLLAAIVDSSDDAIISRKLSGVITSWNRSAERIFGYLAVEMIGQNINLLIPLDRQEEEAMITNRLREGERVDHFETKRRRKTGEIVDVSLCISPLIGKNGEIIGASKVARDISARKLVETTVARNEKRYRSLVAATTAIVWDTVASGEFLSDQPGWKAFTGQSFEELSGWGWLNAIHPDDREETTRIWLAAVASRTTYKTEHRVRRSDQTYRHMLARAVPILEDDGSIGEWVGIHMDITERKEAEERLRLLGSAVEQSTESIIITDAQLDQPGPTIVFVNPAFTKMTGYEAEEVLGKSPRILQGPRTDRQVMSRLRRNLEAGENFQGEAVNYRKDGTEFTLEWRIAPIRNPLGVITHFVAIQRDITERQRNERLALRSQRLESLGTLAGGVAHDLNNALAPILMGVGFLKTTYPEELDIINMFEISAKRGADMVRQLLSFAKGAEGERSSIDLHRLLIELENMMKSSFPKNIEIFVSSPPNIPTVLCDATQIHQVLLNLCVNARDAMPEGGKLSLDAQFLNVDIAYASHIPDGKPGDFVMLRVRDTGTGIPPEILERIFDPFFTTKGPDKGTGLGLSTVSGIVRGHGGFLHAYSQLGQGSTFCVYLPAEVSGVAAASATVAPIGFRGSGETILVVDDEEVIRKMSTTVLKNLNFNLVTASDGLEALIKVAENRDRLAVIITDLHMPYMDGLAFVQALRRILPNIPVIITSGMMDEATAHKMAALGVTKRLDKPFTEAQLAEVLRPILASE